MTRSYASLLGRERHRAAQSGAVDGTGTPAAPIGVASSGLGNPRPALTERTEIALEGPARASLMDQGVHGVAMPLGSSVHFDHVRDPANLAACGSSFGV
jgi:hypothetical protein